MAGTCKTSACQRCHCKPVRMLKLAFCPEMAWGGSTPEHCGPIPLPVTSRRDNPSWLSSLICHLHLFKLYESGKPSIVMRRSLNPLVKFQQETHVQIEEVSQEDCVSVGTWPCWVAPRSSSYFVSCLVCDVMGPPHRGPGVPSWRGAERNPW